MSAHPCCSFHLSSPFASSEPGTQWDQMLDGVAVCDQLWLEMWSLCLHWRVELRQEFSADLDWSKQLERGHEEDDLAWGSFMLIKVSALQKATFVSDFCIYL